MIGNIKALSGVYLIFSVLLFSNVSAEETKPFPATTNNPSLYLFADNRWIANSSGTVRVFGVPEVLPEPIIRPDHPETQRECAWGNVLREPDGTFRLWYATMNMGAKSGGGHEMASAGVWGKGDDWDYHPRSEYDIPMIHSMLGRYAESKDGIHWVKPELGLYDFRGNSRNNIIYTGEKASEQTGGALTNFDGWTVVRDDSEPDPARRYKMLAHWESIHFWDNSIHNGSLGRPAEKMRKFASARGKYITYSPDGIHWDFPLERITFPDNGGDRFLVVRDYRKDVWRAYSRIADVKYAALTTSTNLIDWSEPVVEKELASQADKFPDIESLIPFNYGNQDLGFVISQHKLKGLMLAYLVTQRMDGTWEWVNADSPVIPEGPKGSYYATGAVPLHNEPFIFGDKLYIYFNAFSNKQTPPCPFGTRTIGLAMLKLDRFAGVASENGGAEIITRPVSVSGDNLYLNIEQRGKGGHVRAELISEKGTPLSGYSIGESIPVDTDNVRVKMRWKKHPDLKKLAGKQVSVRILIDGDCAVYSMCFN